MTAWRIGMATLATGLAIGGCTPAPPPPPPAPPAISYDGTYQGTVTLTNVGAGVPRIGCAAPPQMVVQVRNNAFTFVQPHPNSTVAAAGPGASQTTTYTVSIAQNGTFNGLSEVSGQMMGTIAAGHMTGTIQGIECVYSFTANKS
jgi:hypothetical protein